MYSNLLHVLELLSNWMITYCSVQLEARNSYIIKTFGYSANRRTPKHKRGKTRRKNQSVPKTESQALLKKYSREVYQTTLFFSNIGKGSVVETYVSWLSNINTHGQCTDEHDLDCSSTAPVCPSVGH